MDIKQLRDELQAVLDKLRDSGEDDLDVFISIINTATGYGECLGCGCPGCHSEKIAAMSIQGFYKHNKKTPEDQVH